MSELSVLLKKLLPNRLRAYEAIADEALELLKAEAAPSAQTLEDQRVVMVQAMKRCGGATARDFLAHAACFFSQAAAATLGLTPYRSQLIAGLALADGYLLEMGTGEGKTLAAPLAAWLAHQRGANVHVVTANDHLAQRDASQMAPLYRALKMTVAVSLAGQDLSTKRQAYAHDVIYGTANVFALDLLHDDQAVHAKLRVGRGSNVFAIVDEVDQVLIDEAANPVVYSDHAPADPQTYSRVLKLVEPLVRGEAPLQAAQAASGGDFWLDLEQRAAVLTERGYERVTYAMRASGLLEPAEPSYGPKHQHLLHLVAVALGACYVLKLHRLHSPRRAHCAD